MKLAYLLLLLTLVTPSSAVTIPCDNSKLVFAPYAWRQSGTGDAARAEATLPGAYLEAQFTGTATLGLIVDGTANAGCPPPRMPVLAWSVDQGPIRTKQIDRTKVFILSLAQGLAPGKPHAVEIYLKATGLSENRWTASTDHLRVAGLTLDDQASLVDVPLRPKRMIAFGDSITEGVGVEKLFRDWGDIGANNACESWVPLLAGALDCEYGQLGCSGLGFVKPREIPPFPGTWDQYDHGHSRLRNGLLHPEPDYIFNNLGTNDSDPGMDITSAYVRWLTDVRRTAEHAQIFCIVPLIGAHREEIKAAVNLKQQGGDTRLHLIDLPELQPWFHYTPDGTALAYEGVHPTAYGQGVFAAHLAVKVQQVLATQK